MCLFIDYYFLFEAQLLCLSLHTKVLSIENSKWSRARWKIKWKLEKLKHFRHILLFEFNRGAKAVQSTRNICAVYVDNAIGVSTTRKSFSRFKEDRFDSSDTPRSGRPSGFDENRLNTLIHNDPCQCTENWQM